MGTLKSAEYRYMHITFKFSFSCAEKREFLGGKSSNRSNLGETWHIDTLRDADYSGINFLIQKHFASSLTWLHLRLWYTIARFICFNLTRHIFIVSQR